MNSRNTWLWVLAAAGLFAFIFLFERHFKKPEVIPPKVLPGLKASEVNQIQVLPRGQVPIRAVRTNGTWRLIQPLDYPAQSDRIEALLLVLGQLTPAPFLTAADLKNSPDEQFGFDSPQSSLLIGDRKYHVLIGNRTAPGDQVFLQVVGIEGVFVVDADLLKLIPGAPNDWRETSLVDLTRFTFDQLMVTNAGKTLGLVRSATNKPWRIVLPLDTRADSEKVDESLQKLRGLQVKQFVTDDPKADLDSYGLQTPDLSVAFFAGTNRVVAIDFGKNPPDSTNLVYARRSDRSAIVKVPAPVLEPWLCSRSHDFRDFFDHHLVSLTRLPDEIEVHAHDQFTLQRETNNMWRIVPQDFPVDAGVLNEFLGNLTNIQVTEIVREIVPDGDLPLYGMAPPERQYILKTAPLADGLTNKIIAQLQFGTNNGKIFARREDFIYAINAADYQRLPLESLQFREHQIWNFSENDVAKLAIHQGSRTRELIRKGPHNWAPGTGTQGIIDEVTSEAIEETVHRLGGLAATAWVRRDDDPADSYGFAQTDTQLTVELKTGEKLTVKFGRNVPSQFPFPYAAVTLNNETWIFEFPLVLYQYVQNYLTIPANGP